MTLTRLEPAMRVGDQVFQAIHDAIISGDFPAGRRLQIRQLADELGTSVMPVREAIKRLEELGLVETEPYRGAVVKTFTTEELLHVYAVRRLLEVEASRLGAPRMDEPGIGRLRELRAEMAAALDEERVTDYLDADEAFLSTIYAASGNPVLLEAIGVMWKRCRTYKIVGVRRELASGQVQELLHHQDRLIEAAIARDGQFAAQVTAESLDAATSRIGGALAD